MKKTRNGPPGYTRLFFAWVVPGIVLVVIGRLSDRMGLSYFGMALLSVGVFYYGKLKRHSRLWNITWLALFSIYLTLGLIEILFR